MTWENQDRDRMAILADPKTNENEALDRRARFLGPDLCRDYLSPIGQCERYFAEALRC
jgi:hypothetical protein